MIVIGLFLLAAALTSNTANLMAAFTAPTVLQGS